MLKPMQSQLMLSSQEAHKAVETELNELASAGRCRNLT